ncbi:VOC family protein [Variovorax dokdonensis]|uniref:VOC family protein n=1 Tax=Variovorax dokdonensis TaxID=344883 RepID=A0ABT7N841_9BURK|nr:VOC family protein [Variovorax dokdonensis]MDM0044116.1 VOC family protein [Variovorax dokdonensis]
MPREMFPYLCVHDAQAAIDFYVRVFDMKEKFRLTEPGGRVGHVELDFDGATLMLCEEFPEYGIRSPKSIGATGVTLHLHVDNADAVVERALQAGATLHMPLADHFYGERSGSFFDPFGHRWNVGHTIEEVSPEEMQERYERNPDA